MKRFIAFLTATIMVAAASWDCNAQGNAEGNAEGNAQGNVEGNAKGNAEGNAQSNSQPKKVSVLGDSYSTFAGHNPEGYAPFYPNDRNDVTEVEQTWWSLYIKAMGYELEQNNSWGGTTICGTGYGRDRYSPLS